MLTRMKLHCLGTAGYHPSERRHTSCYAVPQVGLVLDAGTGMFRLPGLIATDHLDIVLSHAHLDHVVGLTFLLDILHQRPVNRVSVWGDPEKLEAIRTHLFSELIFPVLPDLQWRPVTPGEPQTTAGGAILKACSLEHPGGSQGYRVEFPQQRRSLAYITDTTASPQAAYVDTIGQVDLLMHECNFRDPDQRWAERTGHSWSTAVAELAGRVQAGQLLLTHINPLEETDDPVGLQAIRRIFPAATVAEDQLQIDF